MIEVIPHKAILVCDLEDNEIEDNFEVRTGFDAQVTRRVAENTQKSDIKYLRQMARKFKESKKRGDLAEMLRKSFFNVLSMYRYLIFPGLT